MRVSTREAESILKSGGIIWGFIVKENEHKANPTMKELTNGTGDQNPIMDRLIIMPPAKLINRVIPDDVIAFDDKEEALREFHKHVRKKMSDISADLSVIRADTEKALLNLTALLHL